MGVNLLVLVPALTFAALAGLFAAGMLRQDPDELPSALIGASAPETPVGTLGGLPPFEPGDLADGEVKLVNFWASWCGPCRVEHPHLQALADEGVPVYGVNYKDDPEKALQFLAELGDPYAAVGTDTEGRVAIDWGVYGVPETFLVDGDGVIRERIAGPVLPRTVESRLRPAIASAAN